MGKLSRVEQSSSVVVVVTVVLKERARRGCLCDFSDWRLLLCFSSVLFDVSMGQLLRLILLDNANWQIEFKEVSGQRRKERMGLISRPSFALFGNPLLTES